MTDRTMALALPKKLGHLKAKILPAEKLQAEQIEVMWNLYSSYYTGSTKEKFVQDLAAKDDVILLRDKDDGSLQGFSTLQCYRTKVWGRDIAVIFSGDTLVAAEYWGQSALQQAFLRYIVRCKVLHPTIPVYWFLISKGYKTYLLLSRNFPEYWPRHDRPLPPWEEAIIDHLARTKYGDRWLRERGILLAEGERLRSRVAPIDDLVLSGGPDIRYFVEKNPHHAVGEELCCIGLVTPEMWLYYLSRWARKKVRRAGEVLWNRQR